MIRHTISDTSLKIYINDIHIIVFYKLDDAWYLDFIYAHPIHQISSHCDTQYKCISGGTLNELIVDAIYTIRRNYTDRVTNKDRWDIIRYLSSLLLESK